jgi:hypothetical protein
MNDPALEAMIVEAVRAIEAANGDVPKIRAALLAFFHAGGEANFDGGIMMMKLSIDADSVMSRVQVSDEVREQFGEILANLY